ncbi:MAG: hypothetical protein EAZ42_01095 [Verrucomicrobia bacterium]|nr:MAG: hypothetical protein EAZ42_01095 [Verrucomicrobiota bacterium]
MKMSFGIDVNQLPEEGKSYLGELSSEIFDLPAGDAAPAGPLHYDLWVQRFGDELLITGELAAAFEFTCVRTLVPFVQTIRMQDVAISLELNQSSFIDIAEALREEIIFQFPAHPRCDHADVPIPCEIDSRYLSVDKPTQDTLATPPRVESDDRWSALDTLKDLKDQP